MLNDVYREAQNVGLVIGGVRVTARGGFDTGAWASSGIAYTVEVDSTASPADVEALLRIVDDVAEIPKAVRVGAPVERTPS